jgi:membrane fusion protein, multidrug efflux system
MKTSLITLTRTATAALLASAIACSRAESSEKNAAGDVTTVVPVRVADVVTESAAEPITATGVVALRDEVALSFKIGGVVQQVFVRAGESVRAGQLLATLDLREIDAQLTKAKSGATKADRDLARATRLYNDSVATRQQLDDASTTAEVARADVATASVNRQYARIIASSDGVILRRDVEPGELVSPGTSVVTLGSRTGGTILRVALADRDVVRIRQGDVATIHVDAHGGDELRGRVRQIGAAADARTGTYEVEISIESPAGLASGMVGRAELAPHGATMLRSVPIEALLEADGDRAALFALDTENRVKRLDVNVAFVRGQRAAVRRGLEGVSRVVTDGAAYLSDGSAVRVTP